MSFSSFSYEILKLFELPQYHQFQQLTIQIKSDLKFISKTRFQRGESRDDDLAKNFTVVT